MVAPGLGMQRLEAAAAIQGQPFTQRLRGHAASPRPRDLVHLLRLLAEQGVEAPLALLSMRQIGDQTVPEQRDPLSCLVVKRHFRLLSPDKPPAGGGSPSGARRGPPPFPLGHELPPRPQGARGAESEKVSGGPRRE